MIKRYEKNTLGTDYAIGDIHGNFSGVMDKLDQIGFHFNKDRLFSVGDLVDRGTESELAMSWILMPWFIPVRGNHDDYVCRMDTVDKYNWIQNGGAWFWGLDEEVQQENKYVFRHLPFALEVETDAGLIGIVHADPFFDDWEAVRGNHDNKRINDRFIWSRARVENKINTIVKNIDHVVVGHSPLPEVLVLGNVHHIDTAGWHPSGYFTVLNLNTMEAA